MWGGGGLGKNCQISGSNFVIYVSYNLICWHYLEFHQKRFLLAAIFCVLDFFVFCGIRKSLSFFGSKVVINNFRSQGFLLIYALCYLRTLQNFKRFQVDLTCKNIMACKLTITRLPKIFFSLVLCVYRT